MSAFRRKADIQTARLDVASPVVRKWHEPDVPLVLTNVCFEGKNGHDADVTPFPLMTPSGHSRHECIADGKRIQPALSSALRSGL